MKYLFIALVSISIFSCKPKSNAQEENSTSSIHDHSSFSNVDDKNSKSKIHGEGSVVGTWKLVQSNIDSENGKFKNIESERKLIITDKGRLAANASLCSMQLETGMLTNGSYQDNYILSKGCETPEKQVKYKLDPPYLVIIYPCENSCEHRYLREIKPKRIPKKLN